MLLENEQLLEQAKEIEKRENKIRQSREDASIIQHLQTLNDDITKLSIVPLVLFLALPSLSMSRSSSRYGGQSLLLILTPLLLMPL
jgi:hypothetical protein